MHAQALKEKVVNFALFKAVFAVAVLGDELHEEIFVWVTWFSVVGVLNLIAFLCRMRADFVRAVPLIGLMVLCHVAGHPPSPDTEPLPPPLDSRLVFGPDRLFVVT